MLRTVWRVRTHEVLEQGIPIVHRAATRCGQAPYCLRNERIVIHLEDETHLSETELVAFPHRKAQVS